MDEIQIDKIAFDTEGEAEAFLRGVRYVDDGVHEAVGVEKESKQFHAVVKVDLEP